MNIEQTLQWIGAIFIITGYSLNAVGPASYPWNIAAFLLGAIMFLTWAIRVKNKPQAIVNIVAVIICFSGFLKAVL